MLANDLVTDGEAQSQTLNMRIVLLSFPVPVSMCHTVLYSVSSKSMNTRLVMSYLLPRTKERGDKA
jgi:hypothetical protein